MADPIRYLRRPSLSGDRLVRRRWRRSIDQLIRRIRPGQFVATLDISGISRATAFVGASYGAMVGMHCAAMAPERIGALLAISGADRAHPFASAAARLAAPGDRVGRAAWFTRSGRRTCAQAGDPQLPHIGRIRAALPGFGHVRRESSTNKCRALSRSHGRATQRAHERRCLSQAFRIDRPPPHRPGSHYRALHICRGRLSDQLVPASDIEAVARAVPHGRFISLPSLYGHDAFLKEERAIADQSSKTS